MQKYLPYFVLLILYVIIGGYIGQYAMENFEVTIGNFTLNIPTQNSATYFIIMKLVSGSTLIIHSILTLFKSKNTIEGIKKTIINKLQLITGIIIILTGVFLMMELFIDLAYFENRPKALWAFIPFILLTRLPIFIVPWMLVAKNINHKHNA